VTVSRKVENEPGRLNKTSMLKRTYKWDYRQPSSWSIFL